MTRSAISPTAALCVMTAVAVPSSRFISLDGLEKPRCRFDISRAPVGSSQKQHIGDVLRWLGRLRPAAALRQTSGRESGFMRSARPTRLSASRGEERVFGYLGHEGHILFGGQAGNQIVELEHEADVPASVIGPSSIVGATQVAGAVCKRFHPWARRGRRGCLGASIFPLPDGP